MHGMRVEEFCDNMLGHMTFLNDEQNLDLLPYTSL